MENNYKLYYKSTILNPATGEAWKIVRGTKDSEELTLEHRRDEGTTAVDVIRIRYDALPQLVSVLQQEADRFASKNIIRPRMTN